MQFALPILAAAFFSSAFASFGPEEGPVANKREPVVVPESEQSQNEITYKECMLLGMKPEFRRYVTNVEAFKLINARGLKNIIETGTSRYMNNFLGDGLFTVVFGCYAHGTGAKLTSVDINPRNCEVSRNQIRPFSSNVTVVCSDSIPFLENYSGGLIDFLYLDSFDYNFRNPGPSQNHHLKEIQAAYNKLHSQSVVMVDDCDLPGGGNFEMI